MKNFTVPFLFAGLAMVSIWSCQPVWWDVEPNEIYSPVDFSKPYGLTMDKAGLITIELRTNLKNRSEDTLGVYLYDNLSSLRLQLTKNEGDTTGDMVRKAPSLNEWAKATIAGDVAKVKIYRSPNQNELYLLPVLRSYKSNGTFRNYFSTSYLKVQLNPWSKLATLNSKDPFSPRLFTNNSSLYYVGNTDKSLYLYKLDSTTNRFSSVGVSSDLNISKFGLKNEKNIIGVDYGFHNKEKNEYHLFVKTQGISSLTDYTIGELILDSDFNTVSYRQWKMGGTSLKFEKIYRQNDTLHVLYYYPKVKFVGESGNPYVLTRSAISLKTGEPLFTYHIDTTRTPQSNRLETVAFLGTDIVVRYGNKENFTYYGLNKPKQEIPYPDGVVLQDRFSAVDNGNTAYILVARTQRAPATFKLYSVKVNSRNGVIFEDLGLNSLPTSRQLLKDGLHYQDNLMLLNSSKEVWQLNPNRTKIDSLSPHTEVVPTNR